MALTAVEQIRIELGDTDVGLPIMSDDEYLYFYEKNDSSVRRASLDAAKTILFKLAMKGDSDVDIFSIRGSKAAEAYRNALLLYIKNPDLNSVLSNVQAYFGGVSKSDMLANDANPDNNTVPTSESLALPPGYFNLG